MRQSQIPSDKVLPAQDPKCFAQIFRTNTQAAITASEMEKLEASVMHWRGQRVINRISNHQEAKLRTLAIAQCLECKRTHPLAELINSSVHPLQDSRFAHDFQHVIEARTNRSAAHSDTRRMNQFAGLTPDFRSELLQSCFESRSRPIFLPSVPPPKVSEAIKRSGFSKSLGHCFGIKSIILRKKVSNPVRNVPEEFYLFLHNLEHFKEIRFVRDCNAGLSDKWFA